MGDESSGGVVAAGYMLKADCNAAVAERRPEPCFDDGERECVGCRRWVVLDDGPSDPGEWFGVCGDRAEARFARGTDCAGVCDWIYNNGTHGYERACDRWEEC